MGHGGKRPGAGRQAGTSWQHPDKKLRPKITALRAETVEKQAAIVGAETDPLTVVANMVLDTTLDVGFRLSAANCCLPFLYPKLSASQVGSRLTVTKVDSSDLLRRLDERIARLVQPATMEVKVEEPTLAINVKPPDPDKP